MGVRCAIRPSATTRSTSWRLDSTGTPRLIVSTSSMPTRRWPPLDSEASATASVDRPIPVADQDVTSLQRLLDAYGTTYGGRVHVDLVMGVPGGMPGTTSALAACLPALPPGASFAATGVGRTSLPVMLAALSAGGHLRVGMEDTLTYAPGQPVRDNAQLVARAAGLARIAQRPPLTPTEARQLLGIPVEDRPRFPAQPTDVEVPR